MGALMGSDVRLAGPAELHPPKDVVQIAEDIARRTGARITITDDPAEGVRGVDFIHTDVWVSMGESKDVWADRVKLLRARTRGRLGNLRCGSRPALRRIRPGPGCRRRRGVPGL